jgi:peptide/nickel transport system ATP-binding protein/oligopeptide transport system ATP-binding protein
MNALLDVRDLHKTFRSGRGMFGRGATTVAVDGVSFDVERGSSFGLVGESGSGKSTTARMLCRLLTPDSGEIRLDGDDILALHGAALKAFRRRVQMVFQDPFASLDPRWTVGGLVAEGMRIHGHVPRDRRPARIADLLERCGLRPEHADAHPHEFSGGQRQRIGIARALAVEPDMLVLDEPVSALDVSIQAQILALLDELRADLGLTYVFIAHDLAVVERFCDRLAVMRDGEIVEEGTPAGVYRAPAHPYTRALLDAVPVPDPRHRDDLVPPDTTTPASPSTPGGP